jgi:hypothetical protein
MAIHGRNNISLKEEWDKTGPTSVLGVSIPDFPSKSTAAQMQHSSDVLIQSQDMFMINGPKGPFTNQPPGKSMIIIL